MGDMVRVFALALGLTLSALQPAAPERLPARERAPLPASVAGQGWGVNLGFGALKPEELDLMEGGDVAWVRRDLFWNEVETVKGQYRWDAWDTLLSQIEPRGIRPVFILCYGNDLYQAGAPTTPEARGAFVRYVMAAMERYQGHGVVWEMWNEPNNHHWQPRPNVQDYIALARDVGIAVKRRFPNEWLVMPAIAGFDWTFLRACLDARLLEYYDAVTVHPYRPMEPESVAPDYALLRAMIARYAHSRDVPILSGEWGYSSAKGVMDDFQQGSFTVRQYFANLASGVPMSIWYNWMDNGTRPNGIIDHFGVIRQDLSTKVGYEELRRVRANLHGYRFDKRIAMSSSKDWALLFERDGSICVASWTTSKTRHTVKAPWIDGEVMLDVLPKYARPEAPNAWLRQAAAWAKLPASAVVGTPSDVWRLLSPALRTLPKNARLEIEDEGLWRTWTTDISEAEALRALASLPRLTDRSEGPRTLRVRARFADPGMAPMAQEVLTLHPEPLRLAISVASNDTVSISIEALQGGFTGKLSVDAGGAHLERDVRVEAGRVATEEFQVAMSNKGVQASLTDARGAVVSKTPVLRFVPIDVRPLALSAGLDGDPKVDGEVHLATPSTGPGELRIDYRFGEGWRYGEIKPRDPKPLGKEAAKLGMWVKGDRSGVELRMRYMDSTGQTFQPEVGPIDWEGWRFVTVSLQGGAPGRWGGMNDGIVYWPIRVTTLALLDNPGGRGVRGSIEIKGAVVMSEGSVRP